MSIIFSNTFETGTDTLGAWFNSTVTQDTADSHGGSGSLVVTSTADVAAVISNNYPYNTGAVAGSPYDFSLWHKQGAGSPASVGAVTVTVYWYDNAVSVISQNDLSTFTPGASWAQATWTSITAPTGTVTFAFGIVGGASTSIYRMDDLIVQDTVVGGSGPPGRPPVIMPGLAATQASTW